MFLLLLLQSLPITTITTTLLYEKVAKFDYGMKENNPVNQYLFYSKDYKENPKENPRKMTSEEVSHMLPQNFLIRSCL